MPKGIEKIINIPQISYRAHPSYRKFATALLTAITYAPDSASYFDEPTTHGVNPGVFKSIRDELDKKFFQELYVDRPEAVETENLIENKYMVTLHGLIGSGKSTILRKIILDFQRDPSKKIIYIDLEAENETLIPSIAQGFKDRLSNFLYEQIYTKYIYNTDLSPLYDFYLIKEDPAYSHIKHIMGSLYGYSVGKSDYKSPRKIKSIMKNPEIQNLFLKVNDHPELKNLLRFFVENDLGLILMFDNVDRCGIEAEIKLLAFLEDIEDGQRHKIPIIIAIRESNLNKLAEEVERLDQFHSFRIQEYLERVEEGGWDVKTSKLDNPSLEEILIKRIWFLRDRRHYSVLNEYLQLSFQEYNQDNEGFINSFDDFIMMFWELYKVITKGIIKDEIFNLFNSNLRSILSLYFNFINHIILSKSINYFDFLNEKDDFQTNLRNIYYKLLICDASEVISEEKLSFPNIYIESNGSLQMIDLKILQYCYNFSSDYPDDRLNYKRIEDDFIHFGVTSEELKSRIRSLAKPRGPFHNSFILINGQNKADLQFFSSIEILPSGKYFLEIFSTTREYAFWYSLITELSFDLYKKYTEYKTAISDFYKYQVIYDFIKNYLFPKFKKELESIASGPAPRGWTRSSYEFYRRRFSFDKTLYLPKLLTSIRSTFQYANIDLEKIENWRLLREKYLSLTHEVDNFISRL